MNIEVIAEIGINHNGNYETAKNLIIECINTKVTSIKFQYRNLDRAYHNLSREIGDESLKPEIKRNYLPPKEIVKLLNFAKSNFLKCGISFFNIKDIKDFNENIDKFDFFKVPSVELTNKRLIQKLLQFKKNVYLSTGCHSLQQIKKVISDISKYKNWTMFHCISNYPLEMRNAKLGFIKKLKKLSRRPVGYSSHDINWEICLLAASEGASVIERHITLDKNSEGLDHSTSSTPKEFKKLCSILNNWNLIFDGSVKRIVNQGEKLNKQNLGRSLVSKKNIKKDNFIKLEDFELKSPQVGLDLYEYDKYKSKKIIRKVKKGEILQASHFKNIRRIKDTEIEVCRLNKISLPVRLHDFVDIEKKFSLNNYEFHLSFKEIYEKFDFSVLNKSHQYSIHLPDYINSTQLIDPFSKSKDQRESSLKILNLTKDLSARLRDFTGNEVVVVGSFSQNKGSLDEFYKKIKELSQSWKKKNLVLLPQWLPPIAWYFGGSVELEVFCDDRAVENIMELNFPICLDICHLFMCKSRLKTDFSEVYKNLKKKSIHFHIADSLGIDGEGIQIGKGKKENLNIIQNVLKLNGQKVIEVWQGHLDNYRGFVDSIKIISRFLNK